MKSREQIITEVANITKGLTMLGLLRLYWYAKALMEIEREEAAATEKGVDDEQQLCQITP